MQTHRNDFSDIPNADPFVQKPYRSSVPFARHETSARKRGMSIPFNMIDHKSANLNPDLAQKLRAGGREKLENRGKKVDRQGRHR
jgi:hypothetical protein